MKDTIQVPEKCYEFLKEMGFSEIIVSQHMSTLNPVEQEEFIDHIYYLMTAEDNLFTLLRQYESRPKRNR